MRYRDKWFCIVFLSLTTLFIVSSPVKSAPQIPFTLGGEVFLNGEKITAKDDVVITLKVEGIELAQYQMGKFPVDYYSLVVPMDSDPNTPEKGYPGDEAYIYISGVLIDENPVLLGEFSETVILNIHAGLDGKKQKKSKK